jgi:hypothetical protein
LEDIPELPLVGVSLRTSEGWFGNRGFARGRNALIGGYSSKGCFVVKGNDPRGTWDLLYDWTRFESSIGVQRVKKIAKNTQIEIAICK